MIKLHLKLLIAKGFEGKFKTLGLEDNSGCLELGLEMMNGSTFVVSINEGYVLAGDSLIKCWLNRIDYLDVFFKVLESLFDIFFNFLYDF